MNRWEVEELFRNGGFTPLQIEKIGELLRILGRYMIVDWEVLQARANEKISLKYLKILTTRNIAVELSQPIEGTTEEKYLYQLGATGIYALDKAKEMYNELNILADHGARSRILTFNHFAIARDYELLFHKQDKKHRYFFCKGNIVCYFPDEIKEIEIIRVIMEYKRSQGIEDITPDQVREEYKFIPINIKIIPLGMKTKNRYYRITEV